MTKLTKKARQVRCISCGKWCASARFKNRPHGSNIFDWAKGGTIHGNCVVREWDKAVRERAERQRLGLTWQMNSEGNWTWK